MILARLGLLAAVVAGSGTCEDETATPTVTCGEEGCPVALRCVQAACVGDSGPVYPMTVRIVPVGDTLASAELADLQFADTPVLTLSDPIVLDERVSVSGQVVDDGVGQPVRRLVVHPEGGVAAEPLIVEGELSPIIQTLFTFSLTRFWPTAIAQADGPPLIGAKPVTYRVRATLRDLPPWEDELEWAPTDRQVVVRVPSTADMPGVQGVVRVNGLPVRAVRVFAVDTVSGRQLSSDSYTDEAGAFAIRLWPTGAAQSVELAFASADPARPLPTHRAPITTPANGLTAPIRVDLPVPGPTARSTVRVGRVQGDARLPLAGVDVRLRRDFATGSHQVRGRTDAAGEFSALVFPGEYVIDLAPSPGSALRLSRLQQTLGAGRTELTARPRTAISGAVLDVDDRPVADARIEATLLEARYADETLARADDAVPYRVFETRTDAAGQFVLSLDPGRHRLLITPSAESGLPPFIELLEFQGDQPRTDVAIRLPPAAVLRGALAQGDGEDEGAPVDAAFVEIWVNAEPPFRLARTEAQRDGRFDVRLPVRLQTP